MPRLFTLYVALFFSGSAALVYQSTWGRMLQRVFGVSDLAIATVLATFFFGLGVGSAVGGRWGTKTARPARLYASLEIAIGAWALLSLLLIPRIHDVYSALGADAGFATLTFIRLLLAFFVLLPPTLLMGATLPILIQAVSRSGFDWSSRATGLYATNTFGAVAGAGFTGLFLVPQFGARVSVVVAAGMSFLAAAIVFALWRDAPAAATEPAKADEPSDDPPESDVPSPAELDDYAALPLGESADELGIVSPEAIAARVAADVGADAPEANDRASLVPDASLGGNAVILASTLAAFAGFASLAGEVLWTRALRLVLHGTTQAFAVMLVNYLLGIALGSLLAERIARRGQRTALFGLASIQLLLVPLTGSAMWVGSQMPRIIGLLHGQAYITPHQPTVMLAASAILLFPLALALGTSIPLAWRVAGGDAAQAARHSGTVLAANTGGGLVGSMTAGFLMVPSIGLEGSIMVVLVVHAVTSVLGYLALVSDRLGEAPSAGITKVALVGMAAALAIAYGAPSAALQEWLIPRVVEDATADTHFATLGYADQETIVETSRLYRAGLVALVFALFAALTLALGERRRRYTALVSLLTPLAMAALVFVTGPSLHIPFLLDCWYDPTTAIVGGPTDPAWDETSHPVFLEEGRNTTVSVVSRDGNLRLFNDGRPESGFGAYEPGFGSELSVLGSLSSVYAADPERAMVIGLGAGHTTTVVLGGPFARVDVVELEAAVVEASRYLYEQIGAEMGEDALPFPLDDDEERTHLVVDDARAQLVLSPPGRYDAIVSQPSHPWLAGSSALYTQEFFHEVKHALREGGVLCLWSNLFRIDVDHLKMIARTVLAVFEYAQVFVVEDSSFIFVASDTPLENGERLFERVSQAGLRRFLRPFSLDDGVDYLGALEFDTNSLHAFAGDAAIIEDDRPVLEFELAALPQSSGISYREIDLAAREIPWISRDTLAQIPADQRLFVIQARRERARNREFALERMERTIADAGDLLDDDARAYLEGLAAEDAGRIDEALAAYQRSRVPDAADRLQVLLTDAGRFEQLLEMQRSRQRSFDPQIVLQAAWTTGRPEDLRLAADVGAEGEAWDIAHARVTRAYLDGGCEALLAAMQSPENTLAAPDTVDEYNLAEIGMRCAFAADQVELAEQLRVRADILRRGRSQELREIASEYVTNNLPNLAEPAFRAALRINAANVPAASGLARILNGRSEPAEATTILQTTLDRVRGLRSAEDAITRTAEELSLTVR